MPVSVTLMNPRSPCHSVRPTHLAFKRKAKAYHFRVCLLKKELCLNGLNYKPKRSEKTCSEGSEVVQHDQMPDTSSVGESAWMNKLLTNSAGGVWLVN